MAGLNEFRWMHVRGGKIDEAPRVKTVQFGDGYEQRAPDGLNNNLKTLNYTFRYSHDEITRIRQFLREHGAVQPFIIYPTDEPVPTKVKCAKWSTRRIDPKRSELTAKFEEVIA
ncbi:phage tail protein [Photobacterium sp. 1_MG-2023]|uniref:phage tail protein n=1 Tax=Photobacterium sp. 1_MG-2023 TaxID=3062646 RepID=UPI0026E1D848|nr:phage tail protein [Photobacterium sp. 1_MG-2023]MDO6707918.1 phage tail protein [Photobacterium sp. 1_MG-2023]